jgi:hypothetical protein
LLLIALWVRSYRVTDYFWVRTRIPPPDSKIVASSYWGCLHFFPAELRHDRQFFGYLNQPAWERTDVGFEWRRHDGAIKVPDLFPIVLAVAAGVAPWIHWSRRFSIRTALVVVTLVAAILGIFIFVIG